MEKIADYMYALDESAIVAITNQRGIITYVNDNFCRISKYSRKELIGQDHRIINSGYHQKSFIRNLWTTIANGKVWKGEIKNQAKDGAVYWVDTTIVPFLSDDGKPYQYVAIRFDITNRKKGEEDLNKTLKEISDYKYALDVSAIVAITDQKGIIRHVNENFCKISKYSAKELIGKDHRIINSGHHSKEYIRELWSTIANGGVWKGELKNKAKDGTDYWVDTTIVPFLKTDGKPYQYVAIRSDITERKKAEEHIKKINHQAVEHGKELESKNRQLVDFCNIVSHNLRGPLINISMLIDYMDSSESEEEKNEVQSKMKPVVNHLMEVFNELVESIQVKQDTGIVSEKLSLKNCLERTTIGLKTQIMEYQATITSDFSLAPTVSFPHKYLESVFTNLISNALKYRYPKRNPKIFVKSSPISGATLISFSDNGLGIDLERHKQHLFKIRKTFHKHPDAKGFGLFMIKTQVEAMGGEIWVESQPDIGSTFFVKILNSEL